METKDRIINIINNYSPELAAEEILLLFGVSKRACCNCVSLCKNTKSKYKHDKFYCLDTGSFIANKDEHTCEAFQHVC